MILLVSYRPLAPARFLTPPAIGNSAARAALLLKDGSNNLSRDFGGVVRPPQLQLRAALTPRESDKG